MFTIFEHKECFEHVEGSPHDVVSLPWVVACCEAKREKQKHNNIQVSVKCCFKVMFGKRGEWIAVDSSGY